MKEKRIEQRLLCAELVQVTYFEESGRQCRRIANLEDICASGLCLQSEMRIPDGTRVIVNYGGGELVGTVRYCIFREIGFFLGIQFEAGCKWSTQNFRPEHLLDPRQLVDNALMNRYGKAEGKVM
ncbi:MAG: hypothetical protein JWP08_3165 [Bryobacterales bacterium]|jgi:hypothetical protein|nr:hypothetical protein [Bryobacterales bacterium]